ncbi:iron chelate uptake ABC transporter family permease subunit [Pseudoroseomonas cervicalis]|uniref:iron chelate uptake ABC transporter family permease subunit n=1 Tax=Teichococcus cervicalis TaxID=204525 RepID=UPI0035ED18AA
MSGRPGRVRRAPPPPGGAARRAAGGAPGLVRAYRRAARRRLAVLALLAAALLLALVVDAATGPALLPLSEVARALLGLEADPTTRIILFSIRLPMALMALVVGAALGVSGVVMQTILNNPLASSYTLGVSAGPGSGRRWRWWPPPPSPGRRRWACR